MKLWGWFWTGCLLVAGPAFAYITIIVTVRGFRDLLDMFRALRKHRDVVEDSSREH
jgi:hypothetical protein